MSDFEVDILQLGKLAGDFSSISGQIQRISDSTNDVLLNLRRDITSSAALAAQRAYLRTVLAECAKDMNKLSNVASLAANRYKITEQQLKNKRFPGLTPWFNNFGIPGLDNSFLNLNALWNAVVSGAIGAITGTNNADSWWSKFWSGDLEALKEFLFLNGHLKLSGEGSVKPLLKYDNDDAFTDSIKDWLKNKGKTPWEQKKIDGKQINKDEKFYDQKGTILEGKAEAKAEVSLLSGEKSEEGEYTQYSLEGKVLSAEAHANASAGLYIYEKDKDGNIKRIFSPGVQAEVGASASVLSGEASGRLGLGKDNKMLGVYGKAEAEALAAEAKAKVAFNKNEVFAGASAEANLVKAGGSAGVSLLGTDIGVNGSVKVGVGAHANVGYTDGKFKVDLGVAVGVGFDVGFELDVSGTVDAVCDFAESAWNGFKGFLGF